MKRSSINKGKQNNIEKDMELVIFVSSIVISAILIMIRGELKDIGESLHKIGKHLDRINKKDGS